MAETATKSRKAPAKRVPTNEAQGLTAVTSTWTVKPSEVTPENVPKFQSNIHYCDAVNNKVRQVYPGYPELWVTDANGETDDKLTLQLKLDFDRLNCYDLMQHVIPDKDGFGCCIMSIGTEKQGNDYRLSEIRHLPPETFRRRAPDGLYNVIPNPLVPGISFDVNGDISVWQTHPVNGLQTKLDNVRIIRDAGTPFPTGRAYMYPVYFVLSLIDFALKAEEQQVNRIGAPMLLMKISDEADGDAATALQEWGSNFLRKWGKDTAAVLPQGLEFPTYTITESTTAKEFVAQCVEWIRSYTNPMSDMTQTGNLGASDAGRMEMWTNFIAAEQAIAESWLEEAFDWCLAANGYVGYETHIRLKRPSVDKSALKLQYLAQAFNSKSITTEEIRDNMTDVLELKEWSDELALDLKNQYPATTTMSLFGNTVDGFTSPEYRIMKTADDAFQTANDATYNAITRIMRYGNDDS